MHLRHLVPSLLALCAAASAAACSGDDATPASEAPALDAGADALDAGDALTDGEGGKSLDPSLWDCRATAVPARDNPVPIGCLRDAQCRVPLVSAHRGAGGQLGVLAPEDTVAAVRAAIAYGVDIVETDPRPTKDGHLVNLHDTTVDRTTTGTGTVSEMTLAEVQALTLRSSPFPGEFACERVPTIEQILTAARGGAYVLIDANKTDRVDLLVKAIVDTDTLTWAIFDTSSVEKIDQALALEPRLLTMIRVADAATLDLQLAHFAAHPPLVVELDEAADFAALTPKVVAVGAKSLTDVFGVDLSVRFGGSLGGYADLYAKGLDILQTDRPDKVLELLGR